MFHWVFLPVLLFSASFLVTTATATTSPIGLGILPTCRVVRRCPAHASWRLRYPVGLQCTCDDGFAASSNLTVCEKVAFYKETCVTRCAGLFLSCDLTSKQCVCRRGYTPAPDGKNCVVAGMGLLGEACGPGCVFSGEQVCVEGVCRCMLGLRPLTSKEIRALNYPQHQCISNTYTLDGSILTTTTSPATTTAPLPTVPSPASASPTTTTTPPTTTAPRPTVPSPTSASPTTTTTPPTTTAPRPTVPSPTSASPTTTTTPPTTTTPRPTVPSPTSASPATTMTPPLTRTTPPPTVQSLTVPPTTTTTAPLLRVLSPCSFDSECPNQASCGLRYPDGQLCVCNDGYSASIDLGACEQAAYLNELCTTRCAGMFMLCSSVSGRCVCSTGYVLAPDGRNCVLSGRGLLGEACGEGCVFDGEQECVDGVCTYGSAPTITTTPRTTTSSPTIPSPMALSLKRAVETTKTATSLVGLFSSCSAESVCPGNASCVERQCICNDGYIASTDMAVCETVVYLNQFCITRCAGLFTLCDVASKLCLCSPGYVAAPDGKNCVVAARGLLGEACGTGCLFSREQVCEEEICRCMPNLRQMTSQEARALNNPLYQCTCTTMAHTPDCKTLIVGLTVGIGEVLLVAAIALLVCLIWRHRRSKPSTRCSYLHPTGIGMDRPYELPDDPTRQEGTTPYDLTDFGAQEAEVQTTGQESGSPSLVIYDEIMEGTLNHSRNASSGHYSSPITSEPQYQNML